MGEYLKKTDPENATCDWCKVTFKYSMFGVTAINQHAQTGKHIGKLKYSGKQHLDLQCNVKCQAIVDVT